MTIIEQQKAAKEFIEEWKNKTDEKPYTQSFWLSLLRDVFGIEKPTQYIDFEKKVIVDNTKYIDAYIPKTRVAIEQKGGKIDLDKKEVQSDKEELTPYEQAKRYNDNLKYEERCRWIVVSNFNEFRIYDMGIDEPEKNYETVFLKDLENEYYRLQFLVDQKNENIRKEEEISVKAGNLVGKLYDALIKQYINPDEKSFRSLNILCVRIVFCLYAEDAGLFGTRTAFEDYIKSFAIENLRDGIIKLFQGLDTEKKERDKYDTKLEPFPHVNGGLFRDEQIEIPNFTEEIVDVIVNHCAPFNWSEISPTIFGAVFESTLGTKMRRANGMHYTSVENIHKVIDPLFMDDLNVEFEKICKITELKKKAPKLLQFQKKLGSLKFLDPACGSGNFLTETYLSLRRLENKAIALRFGGQSLMGEFLNPIEVSVNQFYGIEINDFAVTVAKTALWIAESQMIVETEKIVSQEIKFFPLTNKANIVEGNALRMDWNTLKTNDEDAMPKDGLFSGFATEIGGTKIEYDYIIGNPPFVGKKEQTEFQKEDLSSLFPAKLKGVGNLDYVTGWYAKAIDSIKGTKTKCAFVSTNSITQGEQVPVLWKYLSEKSLEINFARRTFRWDSESNEKAHVHCVIIGFSYKGVTESKKFIFDETGIRKEVSYINGYLLDASDIFISKRSEALCNVPEIVYGSMPIDDNHLILKKEEAESLLAENPSNAKFIRKYIGGDELIKNEYRFCLWLVNASPKDIKSSKTILNRVQETKAFRSKSTRPQTVKLAEIPWLFGEIRQPEKEALVIPKVSSEQRDYIPIAFVSPEIIINGSALIVPDAGLYEFGILMSKVHNAWMRVVGGRLETRYQYSNTIVYNNFPWCKATPEQRTKIKSTAKLILDARAKNPDSSFADMYGVDMYLYPELKKAHEENDKAVMQAYGFDQNMDESEIVAELFKLYEKLSKKK